MKQVQHLVQLTFGDDDGFPLKNFRLDFLSAVVHTFVTTKKQKMMKLLMMKRNKWVTFKSISLDKNYLIDLIVVHLLTSS